MRHEWVVERYSDRLWKPVAYFIGKGEADKCAEKLAGDVRVRKLHHNQHDYA